MKTLPRLFLGCLLVSSITSGAQTLRSRMDEMKTAYTASGCIVVLDGQTLVIEPNMPGAYLRTAATGKMEKQPGIAMPSRSLPSRFP